MLGVPDVIVCGHTDCGVMKGVLNPEALAGLPSVSAWLNYAQAARKAAPGGDLLEADGAERRWQQLENLSTHPSVAARLEEGDLELHGWVYHIGEGAVTSYDAQAGRFLPATAMPARG